MCKISILSNLVSSCTQSRTDEHHSAPTFQGLEALVLCCSWKLSDPLRSWAFASISGTELRLFEWLPRYWDGNSLKGWTLCEGQNLGFSGRFGPEPIIPDPQLQHLCYSHGRGTQWLSVWNLQMLQLSGGYSSSVQRAFVSYIALLLRFGNEWYCWGCVNGWQNCWQALATARFAGDVSDVPVLFKMLRFEWTTWWSERIRKTCW